MGLEVPEGELGCVLGMVAAVGLQTAAFHYLLGFPIGVSIGLGIAVDVALIVGWMFLSFRRRMNGSAEGVAALQRAVEEIRTDLIAENKSVSRFEGRWAHGYPGVNIFFTSADALREAQSTGLLDQIVSKIGDKVKGDPAFGPNRESFNQQEAVLAIADKLIWDPVGGFTDTK